MKLVLREWILFLNGNTDFPVLPGIQVSSRYLRLLLTMLWALSLPACASVNTSTVLIPGKELSRSSLGVKETVNDVRMNEINPYTVYLRRKVCSSELLSIAYRAMEEIRYETQTYDCSDAYVNYIAHNFTALGVPLIYDSVTGFNIFKGNCQKNPPILNKVEIAESNLIINKEEYNSKSASCKETPIAGVTIKARINSDIIDVPTSAIGIAALPPQIVNEMNSATTNSAINFQYDTTEINTVYDPQKVKEQNLLKTSTVNSSLGDNVVNQANDSESKAMLDKGNALGKGSSSEPTPAEAGADPNENRLLGNVNAVSAGNKADKANSSQSMAKIDNDEASSKSKNTGQANPNSGDKQNLLVTKNSSVSSEQKKTGSHEDVKPRLVVRFAANKAVIKKEFRADLLKISQAIKDDPDLMAVIEGHTDNVGSAETNLKMSLKRAMVIKDQLVKSYGVPAERIQVKGLGLTRPIADNGTAKGRAINRRTEVSVISQPAEN